MNNQPARAGQSLKLSKFAESGEGWINHAARTGRDSYVAILMTLLMLFLADLSSFLS